MSITNPPNISAKGEADFLMRVLPWPGDDASGYVNLHWTMPNPRSPKDIWSGKPTTSADDFLRLTKWAKTANIKDIYFCLSRQAHAGKNTRGNLTVLRKKEHALALKAIWLDVDVKTPPKGYANLNDALAAIAKFVADTGLPGPTALVGSGGGVHVYWISDKPLTPDEWRPYAEGLKALAIKHGLLCDAGVTTDVVRILRVPDTLNYKTDPPKPTKLLGMQPTDYDFATALKLLPTIEPVGYRPVTAEEVFFDPKLFPKKNGIIVESLAEGLHTEKKPLNPHEIMVGCAFLRNALATGGKDYDQPQWNLTTLAATFLENGHALAHAMGQAHPDYTPASTDELWARKNRERDSRGLGWPSCKAIQAAGCKACASCKHFAKIKSPLKLGLPTATPDSDRILGQIKDGKINPVAALMKLRDEGATLKQLLLSMNQTFAVVKYGSKIVVASIVGKELDFMKHDDFHNMLANVVVQKEIEIKDDSGTPQKTTRPVLVSRHWFKWKRRRQYVGRGVVFEPGGPLEVQDDILNLWRGFGVEQKPGDWSLMRNHIHDVICSGDKKLSDYVIKWMAYGVQYPDRPIGVAIALRGDEGAGKGFVWRNYGKLFGKHFKHVAHGEHLTGRFNAVLAETCAVFLDEALWAGDRKGEQILKALITEDTFQLERKNYDPIPVRNCLRLMIASNNQWIVPVGVRGRRYCVLDASNKYADENSPQHKAYWDPLQAQFGDAAPDDGRAAMLYDLRHMDLRGFNVRAVPDSAAKTEQKLLSLHGTMSWLHQALQDGAIGFDKWEGTGLTVSKDQAYECYKVFSKQRNEHHPDIKGIWSKCIRDALGPHVSETRPVVAGTRVRSFAFARLDDCRRKFADRLGAPDLPWEEPDVEPGSASGAAVGQTSEDVGTPMELAALLDAPDVEWEPDLEPDFDNWPEDEPGESD